MGRNRFTEFLFLLAIIAVMLLVTFCCVAAAFPDFMERFVFSINALVLMQ